MTNCEQPDDYVNVLDVTLDCTDIQVDSGLEKARNGRLKYAEYFAEFDDVLVTGAATVDEDAVRWLAALI